MARASQREQFRIIGGRWRGRKLSFAARPGLRPTPDRVRETLFNWLGTSLHGARCLDLFAGSGSLGLEALSRGAASVNFVDQDRTALRKIEEHVATLGATGAQFMAGDWRKSAEAARGFDLIFADPPFESDYLDQLCTLLASNDGLADGGRLYVEFAQARTFVPTAPWSFIRQRHAGQVGYGLLTRDDHS
ncbi:MAG: 16S rRNA (guanine(966)-N(2))-methyltransferase RsmD [Gammaproteobacteria bacterium]